MKITVLSQKWLQPLKAYFIAHRYEHDESYLYEEDLEAFIVDSKENPTWLYIIDGSIRGVLSFMMTDYFLKGHKTRIRMFHCEEGYEEGYEKLWKKVPRNGFNLDYAEMFIPRERTASIETVGDLGFQYFRTSYVLIRKEQEVIMPPLPEGYGFRYFIAGADESYYMKIRNEAFANLEGSKVPMDMTMVKELVNEPYQLEDGIIFLTYGQQPVGFVRMIEEDDPTGKYGFVAPLCIVPEHQGKGLGKALLLKGIEQSVKMGYPNTMLSVNGENENAIRLYTKVGFEKDMIVDCFHYDLKKPR